MCVDVGVCGQVCTHRVWVLVRRPQRVGCLDAHQLSPQLMHGTLKVDTVRAQGVHLCERTCVWGAVATMVQASFHGPEPDEGPPPPTPPPCPTPWEKKHINEPVVAAP